MFRSLLAALFVTFGACVAPDAPASAQARDWAGIEAEARGQTVYFHAWGGDPRVNAFIDWAGDAVADRYGVQVEHVKLTDTGEAVSRVLAERSAGRDDGGAVDLVWINGENFAAMKAAGLLYGPWADTLPNWPLVDTAGKPAILSDFTVATEGFEAPWGMAQLMFYHDAARLADPPRSAGDLLAWAEANPGRFAYPAPPDFLGAAFLRQTLIDLAADPAALSGPVEAADYAAVTAPLWDYLDALNPHLWRSGRTYPRSQAQIRQLIADGETDIAFSYNPAEASNAVAAGDLPETTRSFIFENGALANAHFVAIPYNAAARAGALVLANFLMSAEAQAHKQDPAVWGDFTVLDTARLPEADRARFADIDLGVATLAPKDLSPALPEPHPSWTARIETDWIARYGVTQ